MMDGIEDLFKKKSWLEELTEDNFEERALRLFHYQYANNRIYCDYVDAIHCKPELVSSTKDIPFLPIVFFKTHKVTTKNFEPELVFESSGTTETINSKHYVKDAGLYRQSFLKNFVESYGSPSDYAFLCLLPSYLERKNSSLVYMADHLVKHGKSGSGFYLDEFQDLAQVLGDLCRKSTPVVLLGVTFAVLDFADQFPMDLSPVIVMETGGMKGRREEWSREQVHAFLKKQFNVKKIHSEYGMTELLSQAYSTGDGIFRMPSVMRAFVRSENDPFEVSAVGRGCLNIIDLANVHSCAFIATDDLADLRPNGEIEILGRLDHSALRGCSLMVV